MRLPDPGVSVVVPVRDGGAAFRRCLDALRACDPPPREVIVVDDGSGDGSAQAARDWGARLVSTPRPGSGPALARNLGAARASGDIVMFVDADVALRPDAVGRVARRFAADPELAACFGSYDDEPGAPNFLSQYKNLFHHYVHQTARADASTFWAGCGAVRRDVFAAAGGFSRDYRRPAIEDIELGYRLKAAGRRLQLDKELQAKHLKRWTWRSLLRSDILDRGVPWTRLVLRDGVFVNDLNLQARNRVSVAFIYLLAVSLAAGWLQPAAWIVSIVSAIALLALNAPLYRFFASRRGRFFALRAIPLHWLYYLYNGLSFATGLALHLRDLVVRLVTLQPRLHWLVFGASLAIALAPLPWVRDTWVPQGDEPHYLLTAHSLAVDGDLDLDNNYRNLDYWTFYPFGLDRHTRIGVDGRAYLSHDIGLPILIAPAYAVGGRSGVLVFLAGLAALVAVNVYLLAWAVTSSRGAALVTWLFIAFTPLLSVYAYLVYPEMAGALAAVWTARQLLGARLSRRAALGVGCAIGLLPWLSARFLSAAIVLAAWAVWRTRGDRRALARALGPPLLSTVAYVAAAAWMSGGGAAATGAAQVARGLQDFTLERLMRGLAGWLLDQQRGLLVAAPVYVIALIGLPFLWRRLRWAGLALLAPLIVSYAAAAAWGGFWVGWEMPARYLVVGLPLLAAPMALAFARLRSVAFRSFAALMLAPSLLNTALMLHNPGIFAYRESVVLAYAGATGLELWRGLPAMGSSARVDPDAGARTVASRIVDGGSDAWRAPAGAPGIVFQSGELQGLTLGAYRLNFDARVEGELAPDDIALVVDVYSNDGERLLRRELAGRDFEGRGASTSFALPFESPFYNKWSKPVYMRAISTGRSAVRMSNLAVTVDQPHTWGMVGVWLGLIGLAVFALNRPGARSEVGA